MSADFGELLQIDESFWTPYCIECCSSEKMIKAVSGWICNGCGSKLDEDYKTKGKG